MSPRGPLLEFTIEKARQSMREFNRGSTEYARFIFAVHHREVDLYQARIGVNVCDNATDVMGFIGDDGRSE